MFGGVVLCAALLQPRCFDELINIAPLTLVYLVTRINGCTESEEY
jgi:hypothetical protein